MKIQYIVSQKADYLQDMVYTGLCSLLGTPKVRLSKAQWKYFFPYKAYPKGMGFVPGSLFHHIGRSTKQVDLVVLASCKKDVLEQYIQMAASISSKARVVFIDGGDEPEIGGDFKRIGCYDLYKKARNIRDFDLILKREYLKERSYPDHCFPFPFGFNTNLIRPNFSPSNPYHLVFWAVDSHPDRKTVLEQISGKWDCSQNGSGVHGSIKEYKRTGKTYLRELGRSNIALNIRGSGWDTLRYWEIPAVGSLLVSQKPGIVIPHNFKHEEEAIFLKSDFSDLEDRVNFYLKNEKARMKIVQKGHAKLHEYHRDIHRAKELMERSGV